MRKLVKGRVARVIASLIAVVFALPYLVCGLAVAPAAAQLTTAPTVVSMAVAPIRNLTPALPDTLSSLATDAVSSRLVERGRFEVSRQSDVKQAMDTLGLRPPLADVDLVRLAEHLDVDTVVTGEIREAKVVPLRGGGGYQGQVVLGLRALDRYSGTAMSGSLVRTTSSPGAKSDEQRLLTEALQRAAFETVRGIESEPTVLGTVTYVTGHEVQMTPGSRAGFYEGRVLAVLRGRTKIGEVRVGKADPTNATGRITTGTARIGDRLRAIYSYPELPGPSKPPAPKARRGIGSWLLPLLIIAGVLAVGQTGKSRSEAPGSVVASSLANVIDSGFDQAENIITWDSPGLNEKDRFLVWEIWRDGTLVDVVQGAGVGPSFWIDPTGIFGAFDFLGILAKQVTITIDPATGVLASFYVASETTDPIPVGITASDTEVDYEFAWGYVPLPGAQHNYYIRQVIARQILGAGGGEPPPGNGNGNGNGEKPAFGSSAAAPVLAQTTTWIIDRNTQLSSSKLATTIYPPPLDSFAFPGSPPNNEIDVDPTNVVFAAIGVRAADQYVIQIALDPSFASHVNLSPLLQSGAVAGETVLYSTPRDITAALNQLGASLPIPSGTGVHWRVGARNSRDPVKPRPYPLTLTQDRDWVWSERRVFQTL